MLHFPCRSGQGDIIVQDTQQAFSASYFCRYTVIACHLPFGQYRFTGSILHYRYACLICRLNYLLSEQVDKHRQLLVLFAIIQIGF
jgi:hypothetical protein